ncbi:MAG: hypothetical protein ACRDHZ_24760, partial [Ktedonobacteraceae bacterium]
RLADRIFVLEQGHILEHGTHKELIMLQGRYAELFNLQASSYQDSEKIAAGNVKYQHTSDG